MMPAKHPAGFGSTVYLCPPTHFGVEYSINPWMDPTVEVDRSIAQTQWEAFADGLRAMGQTVKPIDPAPGCPDMVFLGDAGIISGNRFLCSNFRYEERYPEAIHYARWFADAGFDVIKPKEDAIIEGLGDIVPFREMAVVGHGPRSNRAGLDMALEFLSFLEVVADVETVDPRFYHLAGALNILDRDTLLYFPPAFSDESAKKIDGLVRNAIAVSEQDVIEHQACNVMALGQTVFMDGCSDALRGQIEDAGFEIKTFPSSELRKGGGSLRCLALLTYD